MTTENSSGNGTDRERLAGLVQTWHRAATDLSALLRDLAPEDWGRPTTLPGWDVRAVAAHCAHLESELAGRPQAEVEVPDLPHARGLMGQFTERGPLARAEWPVEEIIDEFDDCVAERYAALQADPPTDAAAPGPGFAGLIGWSWETLLSNRPLDLWMHEQDIRRAVGRPGGLDSPAAAHVAAVFARSAPYVLGKKVGAGAGTSIVVDVTGAQPHTVCAAVGDDGRGTTPAEVPQDPTARVEIDFADWVALSGGRCTPADVTATLAGDTDLAERFLASAAVTP